MSKVTPVDGNKKWNNDKNVEIKAILNAHTLYIGTSYITLDPIYLHIDVCTILPANI